jgi:hypothetical protein
VTIAWDDERIAREDIVAAMANAGFRPAAE